MNLQEQADLVIAQGALTNSKRPSTFVEGVYPTHLNRGKGCYVWDTNGKRYFDFICGLGCNILGYAEEDVNSAVYSRLQQGATLSLSTFGEVELAQRLKTILPFIDSMKFLKTGTDACNAAIRIARAYTGRKEILSAGYHGWGDEFISLVEDSPGITAAHGWNIAPLDTNLDHIADPDEIAAIIIEPVITDISDNRRRAVQALRTFCTEHGILLIFDEIITGFRVPKYCIANHWGIEPDIICLGKAIANGMPLSVVAGKRAVMSGDYFVSSTFAGETLSIASAEATVGLLRRSYSLDQLWTAGQKWLDAFNGLWPEYIRIEGYPTRGAFVGDPGVRALFFQECCDAGLLFGPSWFYNFPLSLKENITMAAVGDVICKIKSGNAKLRGKMPVSPLAQTLRSQAPNT